MLDQPTYTAARDELLAHTEPVGTETVPLLRCAGRVLAADLTAAEDIPAFDSSPYDGYAFRAADTACATREAPVTLRILEAVAAGAVPTLPVLPGTATKVLTGAPVPQGADAVINFEKTVFTAETVTLFSPVRPGTNIVRAGEDVRRGAVLARAGTVIDAGLAGTLAAQGVAAPPVYRVPRVAVLSTGSELVEPDEAPAPGMIRNANAYAVSAALAAAGLEPVYLGTARDTEADIAALLRRGLDTCDAVVSTGGVSVGDYDLTPAAMEAVGANMLIRGVQLKPGMACAYGESNGKLLCALSGNPASALTNLCAVALPALKKRAGRADTIPAEIALTLEQGFQKPSGSTSILRGTLAFRDGRAVLRLPASQGNAVLSSAIGCDAFAIVPAGSGPLAPGTILKGFLI
jgi:molybdopterin molybdotransferase